MTLNIGRDMVTVTECTKCGSPAAWTHPPHATPPALIDKPTVVLNPKMRCGARRLLRRCNSNAYVVRSTHRIRDVLTIFVEPLADRGRSADLRHIKTNPCLFGIELAIDIGVDPPMEPLKSYRAYGDMTFECQAARRIRRLKRQYPRAKVRGRPDVTAVVMHAWGVGWQ